MSAYCDTSFFRRLLLPGKGHVEAEKSAEEIVSEFGFIPINSLTRLEVFQSIRFDVWRHASDRTRGLDAAAADVALNLFHAELGSTFLGVPVSWEAVLAQAELLTRQTPRQGWRTMDLLHVAVALNSGATHFYSFDSEQNALAKAEGMKVPLAH
ncbi:MAG: PIN domain-containing protein [Verrucomicrobiota bacterium]